MQNLDRHVLNNRSYFFYMHITSVHRGQGKVEIQSQLAAHLPHACPFLITGISKKCTHICNLCAVNFIFGVFLPFLCRTEK